MGNILQGKCAKCGYQSSIPVGGGLRDCYPETALSAASGNPELAAALDAHGQFRIERFPAVCPNCRKLVAPARVTYWTQGGPEHTTPALCPGCGEPLKQMEGPLPCPMCGAPLNMASVGLWD